MSKKITKKTTKKASRPNLYSTTSVTFKSHKSVVTKNDPVREQRINYEIVVDAYDSDERAMGWHVSIDDTIQKNVRCRCRKTRSMSPLKIGEEVDVLGVAPADDCESEMFVLVSWNDRELAVPLEQLEPIRGGAKSIEIIEDWLYWCLMGYKF
ncbi:calcium-binding protein [Planctomycetales bacterium]|nr:calcium-binding protein [Planctomycetales bacterium]